MLINHSNTSELSPWCYNLETARKSMSWQKNIFNKYKKEILFSAVFILLFSFFLLFWHFGMGKSFEWTKIEPISTPSLLERGFYSLFVYLTIGYFLYLIKFYQLLHEIIVGVLGDWRLYKDIKGFIWGGLILVSYFWVVPKIVYFLNGVISFFYNLFGLLLYSLPSLGIALIISIPLYIFLKKRNAILERLKND